VTSDERVNPTMLRKRLWLLPVVAAAGCFLGASPLEAVTNPPPVKKTNREISALSKIGTGQGRVIRDQIRRCPPAAGLPGFETRTTLFDVVIPLSSWFCDEEPCGQYLNGIFVARVEVIRRESPAYILSLFSEHGRSHRGCFNGRWQIIGPGGDVRADGTMVGTIDANTMDAFGCGPCDPQNFFDGCLEGFCSGGQGLAGSPICATISGFGLDVDFGQPDPEFGCITDMGLRIEGTKIVPCGTTHALDP